MGEATPFLGGNSLYAFLTPKYQAFQLLHCLVSMQTEQLLDRLVLGTCLLARLAALADHAGV